jgi:pilus assembly protein CpaC
LKVKIFTILILISFSLLGKDIDVKDAKNIEVIIGQDNDQRLDFAPHTKIEIGNESILTYQLIPAKREITFKGLKPGKTTVKIRNTVYDIKARFNVNVVQHSQSKVVQDLKEFLGDIEGLTIGIKADTVVVGGQIVVPSDIGRIVTVLDRFKDVLFLVELSPQTQRIIAQKMQDEIRGSGIKDVSVRIVNGSYWLEGTVESDGLRARAELIAGAYLPDDIENLARRNKAVKKVTGRNPIENFITVNQKKKQEPVPKLVKITAQFVELTRDYNRVFGFKWIPMMSEGGGQINIGKTENSGVTSQSSGTFGAAISNLFPKLASAKSAGYARVIQSGVVITKDKKQAKLVKTTEKQFTLGTGEFTKASNSKAGFNLDVTPKILAQEKVDLSIGIGITAAVGDTGSTENKVSTTFVVKSKESAAIGGITVSKSSTDYDRDPPFGQNEIKEGETGTPLFSFLRSKKYTSSRTQFVVFITPEIIQSASEGTKEIRQKFRQRRR